MPSHLRTVGKKSPGSDDALHKAGLHHNAVARAAYAKAVASILFSSKFTASRVNARIAL